MINVVKICSFECNSVQSEDTIVVVFKMSVSYTFSFSFFFFWSFI